MSWRSGLAGALIIAFCGGLPAWAARTPPAYGPMSETARYGYKDRLNADGGHTVLAVMPPFMTVDAAREVFDRRAGELCLDGVAKRIVFRAERKERMSEASYVYQGVGFSSRQTLAYEVEGYVYCKPAP